jgi:hypothetical protein
MTKHVPALGAQRVLDRLGHMETDVVQHDDTAHEHVGTLSVNDRADTSKGSAAVLCVDSNIRRPRESAKRP